MIDLCQKMENFAILQNIFICNNETFEGRSLANLIYFIYQLLFSSQ